MSHKFLLKIVLSILVLLCIAIGCVLFEPMITKPWANYWFMVALVIIFIFLLIK
jgi:hypothetical protein